MNNDSKFSKLLSELEKDKRDQILSVLEFGSQKGLTNPKLSDTDLLVIVKNREDISDIFNDISRLENKIFHFPHDKITLFLEKHFFGSNDISGIHAIVLSQEELMLGKLNKKSHHHKSAMKSWRLRFLMIFFICEPILLYKLKNESFLLYGVDVRDKIHIRRLNILDRFRCFPIAKIVLLLAPFSIFNPIKFKVWCLKAIKYNNSSIESYVQIALNNSSIKFEDLKLNQVGQGLVKKYRYNPQAYISSLFSLYCKSWISLFRNISFLWKGVLVFKK